MTTGTPEPPPGAGPDIRARLAELDRLHADGLINAAELSSARAQVLSGGAPASPGAPVAPSSPTPAAGGSGRLVAIIVGVVVAALLVGGAIWALSGPGEPERRTAAPAGDAAPPAFARRVAPGMALLDASAVATGKALARVGDRQDLPAFARVVNRQLDVVEAARQRLAGVTPGAEDRAAHAALLSAVGHQRQQLVHLGRAASASGAPARAEANRARRSGGLALQAYERFFTLAPGVPDVITGTRLADTEGLLSALTEPVAPPRPRTIIVTPPPVPPPVGNATTLAEARALTDEAFRALEAGSPQLALELQLRAMAYLNGSGDGYEANGNYNIGLAYVRLGGCSAAIPYLQRSIALGGTSAQIAKRQEVLDVAYTCA